MPSTSPESAPEAPAVYFVMEDGDVVYVGQTANMARRFKDKKHALTRGCDEIRWIPESDQQTRLRLETIYACAHLPCRNKAFLLRFANGRISEIRYRRRK